MLIFFKKCLSLLFGNNFKGRKTNFFNIIFNGSLKGVVVSLSDHNASVVYFAFHSHLLINYKVDIQQ